MAKGSGGNCPQHWAERAAPPLSLAEMWPLSGKVMTDVFLREKQRFEGG